MDPKTLVKKALYYGGYYRIRNAVKTSRDKRLLILMYHDLTNDDRPAGSGQAGNGVLTRAEFEAHLDAMAGCCRVVSVEEAVREIRYGRGLKENSIALTFDDGYVSVYDVAFPVLKKFGFSATVYLPTDWINGKMSLWWEDLSDMVFGFEINSDTVSSLESLYGEMNIDKSKYAEFDEASRDLLLQDLSHKFMKTGDDRRGMLMNKLRDALFGNAVYRRRKVRPMSWSQISEMAEAGVMFGAHTCSHINMSHCAFDLARDEIVRSKKEIEARLGREIRGFAYPYGYDVSGYARYAPLLEELGFDYACTSWWGNNTNSTGPFQLFRNNLPPMKSRALLKRELYINLSEKETDTGRPPSNYP